MEAPGGNKAKQGKLRLNKAKQGKKIPRRSEGKLKSEKRESAFANFLPASACRREAAFILHSSLLLLPSVILPG
jgi:hypothetical protein